MRTRSLRVRCLTRAVAQPWRPSALLVAAALCLAGHPALAQVDNPLFNHTTDPKVISAQIKIALPTMRRGFDLLANASTPEQVTVAVSYIDDTYRYLRAAQESGDNLLRGSTFPDPLIRVQNARIWQVRVRLLLCLDNRGLLDDLQGEARIACLEGLPEGLRELQIVAGIQP